MSTDRSCFEDRARRAGKTRHRWNLESSTSSGPALGNQCSNRMLQQREVNKGEAKRTNYFCRNFKVKILILDKNGTQLLFRWWVSLVTTWSRDPLRISEAIHCQDAVNTRSISTMWADSAELFDPASHSYQVDGKQGVNVKKFFDKSPVTASTGTVDKQERLNTSWGLLHV